MAAAHIPAHFSWLCEHACETGLLLPANAVANVTQWSVLWRQGQDKDEGGGKCTCRQGELDRSPASSSCGGPCAARPETAALPAARKEHARHGRRGAPRLLALTCACPLPPPPPAGPGRRPPPPRLPLLAAQARLVGLGHGHGFGLGLGLGLGRGLGLGLGRGRGVGLGLAEALALSQPYPKQRALPSGHWRAHAAGWRRRAG